MLAVILATTEEEGAFGRHDRTPPYLLRLGDRPFLQHAVESLVLRGVKQVDFIFSDSSQAASTYFGDGSRWGCLFNFHVLSKAGLKPLLREIAITTKGALLLGRADGFPAFPVQEGEPWWTSGKTIFFTSATEAAPESWTGWAIFENRQSFYTYLDANDGDDLLLSGDIIRLGQAQRFLVKHEFTVRSGEDVLRCQKDLFGGQFPDLQMGGLQVKPGVWMGRNVALHASAKLLPPVFLGANSRIGANAKVGPFTVVADNCIIGADSTICNSLVSPGSYVGESLEIHQSIVDHEQFMDVKAGTSYRVTDKFLLGSLVGSRSTNIFRSVAERIVAFMLLIAFSPVIAIAFLITIGRKKPIVCEDAIHIPNDLEQFRWKSFGLYRFDFQQRGKRALAHHFVSVFLPGLLSVIQGNLSLVGVKPRSAREVATMPDDWRALYLKTKAGLVTDAVVNFEPHPNEDELRASECYYSATESFTRDLKLLSLYLIKLSRINPETDSEAARNSQNQSQ